MTQMHYLYIFGLLLVLACIAIYAKVRASKKSHSTPQHNKQNFHGVTIQPCPGACDAVKELCGKKFLASQAPILPVSGCTVKQCLCSYHHYDDRRDGRERRHDFFEIETTAADKERRHKDQPDRRHDI